MISIQGMTFFLSFGEEMLLIEGLGLHLVHIYIVLRVYMAFQWFLLFHKPTAGYQFYVLCLENCYISPKEKAHLVDTTFLFDLPLAGK